MAVKADWHEAGSAGAGAADDPFDVPDSPGMQVAGPNPDATAPQLRERIVSLFKREKYLFERLGLECPIKDRCDTSCIACPLNEANRKTSQKGRLCRVGVEQEQAETLLAVRLEHVPLF